MSWLKVPVNRYANTDNGPVNVNANRDFRNFDNQNDNIGCLFANASLLVGHFCDRMSNTNIFQKTYDFVRWIYPTVNRFPKSQRFALVQRIENLSFELLEDIVELMFKDTRLLRKKIILELHKLRILFRISKDLAFLSYDRYEYGSRLLHELRELVDEHGMIKDENLQKFI